MLTLPHAAVSPGESPPFALTSTQLCNWYFPGRGLGLSLLIHGIALSLLLFLFPAVHRRTAPIRPWERVPKDDVGEGRMVVFLPPVGGGGQGGGGSKSSSEEPGAKAGAAAPGFVYPGPQPIRSDFPKPTNRIQTLLQPDLDDPPILSPPLDLPNLVSLGPGEQRPFHAPRRAAPELLRTSLDDLPIQRGPVPLPNPVSPDIGPVAPETPDPAQASQPQPATRAEAAATATVRSAIEDLPIWRRAADFSQSPSRAEVGSVQRPGPAEPAVGLAPIDQPERQQPVEPSPGSTPELAHAELDALPTAMRPPDGPTPLSKPEVSLALQPAKPKEQPADPADEIAAESVEATATTGAQPISAAAPSSRGTASGNVAALTPLPTWREPPVEIPAGEARGRFTISPEPNLDASASEPGSLSAAPKPAIPGGEAASKTSPSIVTIHFGGTDSEGSGSGGGDASPGSGQGLGQGPGSGAGAGSGSGPGSGAGSGPGKGPFEGITVIGGDRGAETARSNASSSPHPRPFDGITTVGGGGGAARSGSGPGKRPFDRIQVIGGGGGGRTPPNSPPEPRPLRKRYELFVLSTEQGGGGLPYFGVFSDEQIRTVYLDMRGEETDAAPLWILEFAVPREAAAQANPAAELDESRQGFVLPFPAVKEQPALPQDLVLQHVGKMVIVFAVINVEGKMEQMSVKRSPDPLFDQPVLETFKKWVFRPAMFNGAPVAVKALLGIPLAAHQPVMKRK